MKQTAVQWLVEQIWKREPLEHEQKVIEQAMQMEKEQIEDGYNAGVTDGYKVGRLSDDALYTDAQEYYSETFENPNT